MSSAVVVPGRFSTVDDVRDGLAALETALLARADPRVAFVITYQETTGTLAHWLERGLFRQHERVSSCVVAFGNAYRDAFARYEAGDLDAVPAAWRQSFGARGIGVSKLQHLLLGINAHINHDLPHAVLRGGLNVRCPGCYEEHRRIGAALRATIPMIRRRLMAHLDWPIRAVNAISGPAIDHRVGTAFEQARQHAWTLATALDAAPDLPARLRLAAFIERRAAIVGRRILADRLSPSRWLASLSEPLSASSLVKTPRDR